MEMVRHYGPVVDVQMVKLAQAGEYREEFPAVILPFKNPSPVQSPIDDVIYAPAKPLSRNPAHVLSTYFFVNTL